MSPDLSGLLWLDVNLLTSVIPKAKNKSVLQKYQRTFFLFSQLDMYHQQSRPALRDEEAPGPLNTFQLSTHFQN